MTVNDPKQHHPMLLDVFPEIDFKTPGATRTHYGAAMELIVCKALNLTQIPISGNYEINFDAKRGLGRKKEFYEIKSVRDLPSSKSVIYDWRMEKERPYQDCLQYVFCLHKAKHASNNRDLWGQLQANGVRLLIATSGIVHALAKKQPLQKIKTEKLDSAKPRTGYARKGYKEEYRNLPIRELMEGASGCLPMEVQLWGYHIKVKPFIT